MCRRSHARSCRRRYADKGRSVNRLEQAEVCQDCGRPYLWAQGHNCPGPRRNPEN